MCAAVLALSKAMGDGNLRMLVMQLSRGSNFWNDAKAKYAAERLELASKAAHDCRTKSAYGNVMAWALPS